MATFALRLSVASVMLCGVASAQEQSLAQRLGFTDEDVVLIINGDDLGMCHSANEAVFDALDRGCLTTATLMVPCPWAIEVAHRWKERPDLDIGLHLTHTAEWKHYRWGPVASRDLVPGLIDSEGFLHHDTEPDGVYDHATPGEAYIEAKAQIDLARSWGLEPTHLDSHMGTLQYRDDYFDEYLKLAVECDLPIRMESAELDKLMGLQDRRKLAAEAGVEAPVLLFGYKTPGDPAKVGPFYSEMLRGLKPGVWELLIHPALPTEELKSIAGSWATRGAEYEWVTSPDTRKLIDELGIKLIGYRKLLELQRQ